MEFINGKCPECGGELQIPKEQKSVICMYCGEKIAVIETIDKIPFDKEKYQSILDSSKNHLGQMLFEIENPMQDFTKKTYERNFRIYCDKFENILEDIDTVYAMTEQKETCLKNMAEQFLSSVEESLNTITKKRKREEKLLDYNLIMVVFFFPALLNQKTKACKEFADVVAASWKKHFPQTNLEPADFERINSGFKKRFCYITTAVCESLHKPDDCYELNLLRDYRDHYLMSLSDGEELVKRYYDVAPTIVKHINQRENHSEIYCNIWDNYLKKCLNLIERDQNEECRKVYQDMVYDLQNKYFL